MKIKVGIGIVISAGLILVFQQGFLINFWPINLLLLCVIWLSYRRSSYSDAFAIIAGCFMDLHAQTPGQFIVSFYLVSKSISYLNNHLSDEGLSRFIIVSLSGIMVFFSSYSVLLVLGGWLYSRETYRQFSLSTWGFIGTFFVYELILIFGYVFLSPKK